jgi:sugar phosphate isomerase/epimerase
MQIAICNELFEPQSLAETAACCAALGYEGLELAPFTLAPAPGELTSTQRRQLRHAVESAGLRVVGLHWLLARTSGFHLTASDPFVRQRTAQRLAELAYLCRDLGGQLLVLGSPQQRQLPPGMSFAEGLQLAADTLTRVLPALEDCQVDLCLEPLGRTETNFLNSCSEALALANVLAHPRVGLHLDVKALADEGTPIPDLIRRYGRQARHFHANDPNRRGPGFGDLDFVPVLSALRESGYQGWVSVEVFDYSPDPLTVARESLACLRRCAAALQATTD